MHAATAPEAQVGLNPHEALELQIAMRVARGASKPDRFAAALVTAVMLVGLLLGAALYERWAFKQRLPAFHPRAELPVPLYAANWYEPPRSLDEIMASIRAERGR